MKGGFQCRRGLRKWLSSSDLSLERFASLPSGHRDRHTDQGDDLAETVHGTLRTALACDDLARTLVDEVRAYAVTGR